LALDQLTALPIGIPLLAPLDHDVEMLISLRMQAISATFFSFPGNQAVVKASELDWCLCRRPKTAI